ncbi:MAG: Ig-like domain-containing protein, partial [Clostridiales Family XIII bacterium]|nr:Ig-like domain-containing protein [Clostridiales Family XIII bacterium]
YNGYGFVTVTATPVAQDPGGEPNDTQLLAKPIALNTDYSGNIGYHGKETTNATDYSQDWYDWYSFEVPQNNYGLNITFSRTNDGTQKNLTARLINANESRIGEEISLKNQVSVTKNYNIETAGTYYFQVYGWSMSSDDCTEYSFRINGVEATTITMKKTAKVEKGKSITLKPSVTPATPAPTLTWTSSDTSVATVSTTGVVKGKKAGTVNITASVNGVSGVYATCAVTVTQPVTKVKLNKKTLTLKKGAKYTLKATVTPKNATNKKLKWTSSNKKVVKVSSKGKVTALKKGTAIITVKTHNGKTYKCKIRVI